MKMKKLMIVAVMAMTTVCAQAQSDVEAYFTTKEMPDMLKWCPAPPDTVGAAFTYDIMQYMWGKQMRLARLEYRCKAGLATPAEVKAYKNAKK